MIKVYKEIFEDKIHMLVDLLQSLELEESLHLRKNAKGRRQRR